MTAQARFVRQHFGGPEPAGQLGLGLEARDDGHRHVGVERPQDRDRAQPQRAGPVHQNPARSGRRVAGDRVQGHRERVGEHGHLVGNRVGHREQHAVVGRHQLGVSAGHVGRHPGVDAGFDVAVGEAPAQAVVAVLAGGARRFDAARPARQPRVEHHPLPDLHSPRLRPHRHHVGHHLVAHDLREGTEGGHRVVDVVLAEVHQDLFGVRPADAGQPRPGDHPILVQRLRIGHLTQRRRGARQVLGQQVGVIGNLEGLRRYAVDERLHRGAIPATPAMNVSMSAFFTSTTAFMSGT